MRSFLQRSAPVLGWFCLVAVAAACNTGRNRARLPDGSYEVKCEGSLATCLLQMEQVCADAGYDVLRASEKRERAGPLELQTEIVRSQGIVRCRKANALLTIQTQPPEPTPAPVATEAAPPLPDHAPLPPLHAPPSAAAPAPSAAPPSAPSAPPAPTPNPSSTPPAVP
jgi:hypothetical protein